MSSTASPASSSLGQVPFSLSSYVPGLLLAGLLAAVSMQLGKIAWLQAHGISVLTLAIVLGMAVGNTVYGRVAAICTPGIGFSKQRLLRLGIVLYGFRLTFQDIGHVGAAGVVIDILVMGSVFTLAWVLGTRVFGIERRTAMLIGSGSAICGAAAVMAAQSVVRGRPEQVTIAVSTVVVFGTLAMFLYPPMILMLQAWHVMPEAASTAGLYIGATVHEVAQVAAAGASLSPGISDTAVITKMVRVMMLAPFLLALSAWLARSPDPELADVSKAAAGKGPGIVVPWFAVAFVAMAGINSLGLLPHAAVSAINDFDMIPLAMAMAALGLTTQVSAIRLAGRKPILLATALFAWLVVGGLAITLGVTALMG